MSCLLYTSDAADDLLCVDLGGRRIIKKKKKKENTRVISDEANNKDTTITYMQQHTEIRHRKTSKHT